MAALIVKQKRLEFAIEALASTGSAADAKKLLSCFRSRLKKLTRRETGLAIHFGGRLNHECTRIRRGGPRKGLIRRVGILCSSIVAARCGWPLFPQHSRCPVLVRCVRIR